MTSTVPPCLLIIHKSYGLHYYVLTDLSEAEVRLLDRLKSVGEAVMDGDSEEVAAKRRQAVLYVSAAVGLVCEEELKGSRNVPSGVMSGIRKWVDTEVFSLQKVNEQYAGLLYKVFACNEYDYERSLY